MLVTKILASPIGKITLVASAKGLRSLSFGLDLNANSDSDPNTSDAAEQNKWLMQAEDELEKYFDCKLKTFQVPLDLVGTPFQIGVWNVLKGIPYGTTISYSDQAIQVGNLQAIRAVASANGKNPIGIIVPCHRVIAKTRHLHGYAGGLDTKKFLLEIEGMKISKLTVEL